MKRRVCEATFEMAMPVMANQFIHVKLYQGVRLDPLQKTTTSIIMSSMRFMYVVITDSCIFRIFRIEMTPNAIIIGLLRRTVRLRKWLTS